MFESERKRAVIERCLIVMLGCCILAYLGMCAIINFRGFERYCDSDMYADTLVSRLMWEQKTFFPKNWIFSNQFYFIATPVLSALFYGLTGNSNTAMALATSVMTGLIFVSFLWLLQAITKDFLVQLFACFLFISSVIAPDGPSSLNAQLFFVMASYYACYLIAMFVVFGDYIRATKSTLPRLGTWILCLFLSFTTGMQSLRQTVVMVLPILAYEFFLAIRRMLQGDKPWNKGNIRTLIRAASYAVANVAGVITIELINPPHTSIYGDMALTPLKMLPQQIPPIWVAFQEITDLDYAFNSDYSVWFAILCFFFIAIVFFATILWFARIRKQEDALELCWILCLIGIFGVILSCVILQVKLRSIYIFMWYPLVAFSGLILLRKFPFPSKCIAIVLTCILSLSNLYYGYYPYAGMAIWKGPTDAQLMCEWAMEEGYEYVYGSWFVSPRIAVHSDGEITAGYWHWDHQYSTLDYNITSDIYDEDDNAKAIYVFISSDEGGDEDTCLQLAEERGITMSMVAEFGKYRAYTSPIPLMNTPIPGNN